MRTPKNSPTSSKARRPPPPRRKAARGHPAASTGGGSGGVIERRCQRHHLGRRPTNALIITAPPKIMKSLMAVIDKLDIRRAQVEVEAIIVEVDVNKSSNLGVQWITDGGNN
jgi:general secretion pathway protein D